MLPFLRLDGYYVVSDLVGVPDLFRRIGPVLRSAIPFRAPEPEVAELKPWVRRVGRRLGVRPGAGPRAQPGLLPAVARRASRRPAGTRPLAVRRPDHTGRWGHRRLRRRAARPPAAPDRRHPPTPSMRSPAGGASAAWRWSPARRPAAPACSSGWRPLSRAARLRLVARRPRHPVPGGGARHRPAAGRASCRCRYRHPAAALAPPRRRSRCPPSPPARRP